MASVPRNLYYQSDRAHFTVHFKNINGILLVSLFIQAEEKEKNTYVCFKKYIYIYLKLKHTRFKNKYVCLKIKIHF